MINKQAQIDLLKAYLPECKIGQNKIIKEIVKLESQLRGKRKLNESEVIINSKMNYEYNY